MKQLAKLERKKQLQNAKAASPPPGISGLPEDAVVANIRSDINPEAGENLRKMTLEQNLKRSQAIQSSIKNRSTAEKREDLCEMLGRGC